MYDFHLKILCKQVMFVLGVTILLAVVPLPGMADLLTSLAAQSGPVLLPSHPQYEEKRKVSGV